MLPNRVWNSVHRLRMHRKGCWLSETDEPFSHLPVPDAAPGKQGLAEVLLGIRPGREVLQQELTCTSNSQALWEYRRWSGMPEGAGCSVCLHSTTSEQRSEREY